MLKMKQKDRVKNWTDSGKKVAQVAYAMALMSATEFVMAAGVDTGQSSMNSFKTWLMQWIPIGATIVIMLVCLGWMLHMVQLTAAGRVIAGMIGIGSASYIAGLFGLGG